MTEVLDPNVWLPSEDNPGYLVKTIKHGNCTIQVLRPILTEAERKKRETQVIAAASNAIATYYKQMEVTS